LHLDLPSPLHREQCGVLLHQPQGRKRLLLKHQQGVC